jgi:hypothetical protein
MMKGLDDYITGHYGEDQFRERRKESRAWSAGAQARANNKRITDCRCRSDRAKSEWKAGWADEDMAIKIEEEDRL